MLHTDIPLPMIGGIAALGLGLLLTPLAQMLGWRLGILARPGPLSVHLAPVPRTGGLGIIVATAGAAGVGGLLMRGVELGPLLVVVGCAGLLFLIGLAEDARGVAPRLRLLLQAGVGVLAFALGVRMETFPLLSLPITLVVLVGAANAFNMLDGLDGLAAGVAFIAALFLGILAWLQGSAVVLLLAACLAGACGGFLPFNVRKASLFLGDGGSLVLGFTLAALAAMLSAGPWDLRSPLAAGFVLGLPALDLIRTVIRRRGRAEGIIPGDREHIYDLVHRQGMGTGRVVLVMYGVAFLFGFSGLAAAAMPVWAGLALAAGEAGVFAIAARRLTLRVLAREQGR
jgi:UDP-GlcNAc:undecaprenyl-phosphate GlcNAc-1-phosphate transferase